MSSLSICGFIVDVCFLKSNTFGLVKHEKRLHGGFAVFV